MKTYIYTLIDPRNSEVKYVGKANNPKLRLKHHIYPSGLKPQTLKNHWLKEIIDLNLLPIINIIEECQYESWEQRERFWIKYYKDLGCNLTNETNGGSYEVTDIIKEKLSLLHSGKNSINYGKKFDVETKVKMSLSHQGIKRKNSTSIYMGVSYNKKTTRWTSCIWKDKKRYGCGIFSDEIEAAKAYDKKVLEIYGKDAKLNFP